VAKIWDRVVKKYSDVTSPPGGPCSSCSSGKACLGGCKAFHYIGKHDERCGETRFAEDHPHGLTVHELPVFPTASLTKKAGEYQGLLRVLP
jgi:hypothetical protein